VETAVDGIIVIDAKGLVDSINPAAENVFGYRADEVIGRSASMLMPSTYREEHDGYVSSYVTTGVSKIIGCRRVLTGLRKDGSSFPMELTVSEMTVGGQPMFTGILRDITERQ